MLAFAGALYKAHSYGLFRNWRKDVLAFGVSDIGGVPMFVIPEDFKARYDISLISSGLLGIHAMTGEISGKEIRRVVLSGEVPIFISKKENTIAWAFLKREYPKLVNRLDKLHTDLEREFGAMFEAWTGLAEEVEEARAWIASKLGLRLELERIEEETEETEEIAREFEETFRR